MSKAIDCFDQMNTTIANVLTTYIKLPDPYRLTQNPDLYLQNGFGISFGSSNNTNRQICLKVSISRSFSVILIKKIFALDMSDTRRSFEKDIINDLYSVINAFENDRSLNSNAVKIEFLSDSGVQFLDSDTEKYLMIESTFNVEYFETIT